MSWIKSRIIIIYKLSILFLLNIFSFVVTFILTVKLFSNQKLSFFLYQAQNIFTSDPAGILANNIIFFLFIFFPLNYLIYVGLLEGCIYLSRKRNTLELVDYHSPEKVKHLLGILTFLIVLFGFLPLFINFFTIEDDVKKSINSFFFLYVSSLMCPYLYMIREDSAQGKMMMTERQTMVFIIRKVYGLTNILLSGIMKTYNNLKKPWYLISLSLILSSISILLIVASLFINEIINN